MKGRIISITMLVVAIILLGASNAIAQSLLNKKISIHADNAPLLKIIEDVQQQTVIRFVYSPTIIEDNKKVSYNCTGKSLKDFLEDLFYSLGIAYKVVNEKSV